MNNKFDIIIIGAGILGVASAYHLQLNNPEKKILLIERLNHIGEANTAMCAAAIRNMFSSPLNLKLTDTSINYYLHVQKELKIDLQLDLIGYLWLTTELGYHTPSVQKWIQKMKENHIEFKIFELNELKKFSPSFVRDIDTDKEAQMMKLNSIRYGIYGSNCGVIDPSLLINHYFTNFRKLSKIKPRFGNEVTQLILEPSTKYGVPGEPFAWQDSQIIGVKTKHNCIYADTIVLATGAWANELLDKVGIPGFVKSKKEQLFKISVSKNPLLSTLFNMKGFNNSGLLPLTILPNGIYFRPVKNEQSFWIGYTENLGREYRYMPNESDFDPEPNFYEENIYPVLSKYFPEFLNIRPEKQWGGTHAYSFDNLPYVYREGNVIIASGASGSGIMKADSIARIVDAIYRDESNARLYNNILFNSNDLGILKRSTEKEDMVI